jgi:hypothetical protein
MLGEVTLRATLGATLAVLGAVGAIAAGSHAANAAATPDTFTVVSVLTSVGNSDQLNVVVESPSTLSSLSAGFVAGGTDVFDQTLTQQGTGVPDPNDSTQTDTTWTASIPAGASGLALGTYSVTLTGVFSDSTTPYSVATSDTYPFLATSSVTLNATSTSLGYGDASTGLSGQVTLTNPDTTPDTDFSSLTSVTIESGGTPVETLPLSSTGAFSDPSFTPSGNGESIDAVLTGTATVQGSSSSPVTFTVGSTTPTLKLNATSVTETYGKTFTVSGTLAGASGGIASQKVWINTTQSATGALATATTNATGGFTITVPTRPTGGTLYVGSASGTDLAASAVGSLALKVVHPTVISGFRVGLSQYWGLTVLGCVGFPATDKTEKFTHTTGLMVQWASPGGAWHNLGWIPGNEADHACGTNGIAFTGSFTAPENYAYYRIAYSGTSGTTSFAPSTSPSELSWRYADRITSLKVSPTTVNAGGKLTISGVLQYYYSGWHNYGGQTVVIYLHPKGSSPTWYWLVKVKTNSKGQFSTTFKDPVSATWQAVYEGSAGHLSTGSSEVYVRLK